VVVRDRAPSCTKPSPKSGYVVVVLANFDPPAAQRISDYLDPRLPNS
jgi:hypothetical protein